MANEIVAVGIANEGEINLQVEQVKHGNLRISITLVMWFSSRMIRHITR